MTNEELDEARAKEAQRLWEGGQEAGSSSWVVAARLARENWTPPEPEPVVDPDVLAFREWAAKRNPTRETASDIFLAGARMAREREQERAKGLVWYVEDGLVLCESRTIIARKALAKYRGEA
jgi:hypothetical protein